jgi:hypothetical protein
MDGVRAGEDKIRVTNIWGISDPTKGHACQRAPSHPATAKGKGDSISSEVSFSFLLSTLYSDQPKQVSGVPTASKTLLTMADTLDPNESAQGGLTAVCTVMLTLATTAVFLRRWPAYADSSRKLGLDDYFVTASLAGVKAIGNIARQTKGLATSNADTSNSLSSWPNRLWYSGG